MHSEILNITIRDLRHASAAGKCLEGAASNATDIIRRFSVKTQESEGETRLLEI